ncbi:RagB/SusD family nutrient uptake outer membrane protein [Mucilaginibacter terrenus]|uniref:RagB/SusD family nutrient uptake outer membrane protein n=1 Tax=Mucilaginibacter terrenus TaxID=2482727 RepID=A0A3E2NW43_9SPHI|nr:RagB/SusD family nutrient uptake outer membrane protein [Mucilaginibacter terrenus]RFZ85234.1 RagB/SusD family nutrient uptake outer membrane protein [Mucilaginibacter terrenus]
MNANFTRNKNLNLILFSCCVVLVTAGMTSCKKYLDVVPDNVATIEHAFANRTEAEKVLFTCYSYLPDDGHPDLSAGLNGGDELWTYWPITQDAYYLDPYNIARGLQNPTTPNLNYWDDVGGKNLWQAIRMCNIFLENINKVSDIDPFLKNRWISEAKFLKAYYHWYMFRQYGPIPVMDKNLEITASPGAVKVYRLPVDSVVHYISDLIDDAVSGKDANLPDKIANQTTELGRVTKPAALAIKARLLVTAASPLFNGNSDFSGLKNNNGQVLFNATYDPSKWQKAATACKAAIDAAEKAGSTLYHFNAVGYNLDDATKTEMSIRNAMCEKWNNELIWGGTSGTITDNLQLYACPQINPNEINLDLKGKLAPTLKMAELFYTNHGVPIDEDKTWDYAGRYQLRATQATDTLLQPNYRTAALHFDREPRFYADLGFDGAKWFMKNGLFNIQSKAEEYSGKKQSRLYSVTGYFAKKVVNWNLVESKTSVTLETYPWPIMRLSDLYLLYAEALNESGQGAAALPYLNRIRERAGLNSVESSWTTYSKNPGKFNSMTGLRSIIQQERGIELAFEGSRFWDLRRWKTAPQVLSQPVYGWDVNQKSFEDYNRRVLLFTQRFEGPKDYLWPIKESDLQINPNLVQNPGW